VRALALAALLASCAAPPTHVQTTLYLGRAIPAGGVVDDRAVEVFVADTVARHLPAGFTLIAGTGGWRDTGTGRTITEPTLVLIVLHPSGERGPVEAVARAWAERFGQQSVLRVELPVSDLRF
jgi:hypothetical protein